jgi:plastocyanin
MKKKILASILLLSSSLIGFCTTWTISNSGFSFTPATITINLGDSVNFGITASHDAREVSMATWNVNGSSALPGGFQTPFGGGLVLPAQLGLGTHYYVCTPHASSGMKAKIIVQNSTTGIAENQSQTNLTVYPNPSNGKFQFALEGSQVLKNCKMEIYNVQGVRICHSLIMNTKTDIDLSNQPNGIYFVKFFNGQTILTKKIVIE